MADREWDVDGAMAIVEITRELARRGYDAGTIAGACIGHGAEMYKQGGYSRADVEQHALLLIGCLFGDPIPEAIRQRCEDLTAELRRRTTSDG